MARFIVRSLRHNHSSTSFVTIAIVTCQSKLHGRVIVASLWSPLSVLSASLLFGLVEIVAVTSLIPRDRFLYQRCLSRPLAQLSSYGSSSYLRRSASLAATKSNPMAHPRNRRLMLDSWSVETDLELVFIWSSVIGVLWYGVSLDGGRSPPEWRSVLLRGVIQHLVELAVDLIARFVLVFYLRVDALRVDAGHDLKWSLVGGAIACHGLSYAVGNTYAHALCSVGPTHSPPRWACCVATRAQA